MAKLIAISTIVATINGVRTVFEPGTEVVGLNKVDTQDLITCGALEDATETAAQAKKDAAAEAKANKAFDDARAAVQERTAAAAQAQSEVTAQVVEQVAVSTAPAAPSAAPVKTK
jgi:hypothetical protein